MIKFPKKQSDLAEKIDNGAGFTKWRDWRWQLKHSIRSISSFETLTGIQFDKDKRQELEATVAQFPLSITPYYLSLIEKDDYQNDPIFLQSFADPRELVVQKWEREDPLHEDKDSPVEGLTHRYPDRVLFHVSNICSMYCRHCTRKRKVGDVDSIPNKNQIRKGIDYIRNTPSVRDVLLSGGDPLMLDDDYLDWILTELRRIEHVEIVRIGSRMPVVLPYRVTDDLVLMLKKHHPVWLNTHFNHPRELTHASRTALAKLADAGIPLGNQSVLLAGVNDCPRLMKTLVQKLVYSRVRPYYLYQCDLSEGLTHFRTPVGKGIEILESLIGHTSGFSVPTYVIDAPGGGGKIPIMPNYLLSWSPNKVVLRNYEGVITTYREPEQYHNPGCDGTCEECTLQLKFADAEERNAIGIEKLLSEWDETYSLTPEDNERIGRRNE
ncbi:lysine 2,3-aminomutase [Sediminispirochaeta smaragdinae]|jgi:lysine 2,3-aminomutase|uniref:L-lysine 2,3-aminomutase n=1 Tax=Sediminispirochaeta smaragdinae (strain DSM 11293 / JCM 15392 / SEBR 4228) TaxID=573413 RepID=E1R999_SEDSS|nr:lysine 2,3-aminomutase [Sediminispirochaeta smaragdinae]ADK83068.1 lysine 2,3-aminomutase YodO family protein [Sediminispirochaeta smaragdinae DSM 11293]